MKYKWTNSFQTIQKDNRLNFVFRYGVSILVVIIAFWLYSLLTAWFGPGLPTYILFYPAVIITALLFGFRPGILATTLSVIVVGIWILPPIGQFMMKTPIDQLGAILFSTMGVLISSTAELYRRNRAKAAAYDKEKALRETLRQKEFLANLLEQASQPFAVGYLDGRLGLMNHAFEQLTGYTEEELRKIDWSANLTPNKWHELEKQKLDELHQTGRPVKYEKEYIRKDGSIVPIELLVHMIKDAEGKPDYYYSFIMDISERKKSEKRIRNLLDETQQFSEELEVSNEELKATTEELQVSNEELQATTEELHVANEELRHQGDELLQANQALKESEQRLRRFYESGLLGVIFWNMDGEILDANDKFLEMMGYTQADLETGQIDWVNMTPPEYRHLDEASMKELKATGVNKKPFEKEYVRKDGKRVPIIVAGAMLDDARHNGIAFVLDITDRKKAEVSLKKAHDNLELKVQERTAELEGAYKSLKESELKFKTLAENSVDIIDRQDRQFRHLFVNNIIYKLLGIPPEDFIGKTNRELGMSEELVNLWEGKTQEVFDTGKIGHMEFELPTQNGINYYQSILVPEYNPNNKIESVLIMSRDITELKQAEEQLKEIITELERSNKELQSFAYITSHDLQEPLRTMGNYAGLLKKRYEGQLDEDADDFLDFMASGAARMKDMVQGLLDYSRVGTQDGEFKKFNAEEALDSALINLKSAIEECHVEINHEHLPEIFADESQISRVFQNLIGNALKFRKKGVKPVIHISARNENGEYVFSVQDNGIGVEEEYTDRIFEVFKRLHAIGEYHGVGIGLAVVKRIVERHGGRVWVESEFGVGSTFYFTIPFEN